VPGVKVGHSELAGYWGCRLQVLVASGPGWLCWGVWGAFCCISEPWMNMCLSQHSMVGMTLNNH
jgi:hypothetical protein